MLRDCGSALILAALASPFYAVGIYLSPFRWSAGYGVWDLLVLLGVVLTVGSFVFEFRASRRSRRLSESGTALGDCSQRLEALSREKDMRLNAYVATLADCTAPPMEAAAHPVRRRRSFRSRRSPPALGNGALWVCRL